jgi:hypothetical protein
MKEERILHEKKVACATLIQATWRRRLAMDETIRSFLQVIIIQGLARRWLVIRKVKPLIEERQRCKQGAVTLIQSTWRGSVCKKTYKKLVEGEYHVLCMLKFLKQNTDSHSSNSYQT